MEKKHLNILIVFTYTVGTISDEKGTREGFNYTYWIYAAQGEVWPDFIEHDTKVFEHYYKLMDYARLKACQFYKTTEQDYHTISYQ